jgi:hypothetical protein
MNLLPFLFNSKARACVVQLLFGFHNRAMYLSEISHVTGMASRSIEIELKHLAKANLLISTRDRSRIYYSANRNHPAHGGLKTLVAANAGIPGLLQEALALSCVEFAILSSTALEIDSQEVGELPIIIIVQPGTRSIADAISAASTVTQRKIHAQIFTLNEICQAVHRNDPIISAVLAEPDMFIIGRCDHLMKRISPNHVIPIPSHEVLLP